MWDERNFIIVYAHSPWKRCVTFLLWGVGGGVDQKLFMLLHELENNRG